MPIAMGKELTISFANISKAFLKVAYTPCYLLEKPGSMDGALKPRIESITAMISVFHH